jgi:hypothetical protein
MIARVRILLPIELLIRQSEVLPDREFAHGGYNVRMLAPYRSSPPASLFNPLEPTVAEVVAGVQVDGEPAIAANSLEIQFHAPEFNRRRDVSGTPVVVDLAFDIADSFLIAYRTLGRVYDLRVPLRREDVVYYVRYVNDDYSELPEDALLCRGHVMSVQKTNMVHYLPEEFWEAISTLSPVFNSTPHDRLILDALDLLPDVGPALAIACTAVEVRIASALGVLAGRSTIPPDLWKWIYRGNGPQVQDELNSLFKILGGRTLQEDKSLATAYETLVKARNCFLHEGTARVSRQVKGKTVKSTVSVSEANTLILDADRIITWIEEVLPESEKRPQAPIITSRIEIKKVLGTA